MIFPLYYDQYWPDVRVLHKNTACVNLAVTLFIKCVEALFLRRVDASAQVFSCPEEGNMLFRDEDITACTGISA